MNTHHLLAIIASGITAAVFLFGVIYTLTKNAPIRYWVGGAWAAFVNGFIEGAPVGSPAGAGIAVADNQVHADLGLRHIAIEAAHVLAVPFFTGLADVRSFTKSNPFPNPFTNENPANPPPGAHA
jgi:hypothetical protein